MHLNDSLYIDPKRRRPDVLFWGSVPWPALDPRRAYELILNILDRSSLAAWWIFWLDMVWLISPQKPGYDTLLGNWVQLLLWLWSTEGLNFNYTANINNLWFLWGMIWVRGPFPHLFIDTGLREGLWNNGVFIWSHKLRTVHQVLVWTCEFIFWGLHETDF